MWESSIPKVNENINPMFATANRQGRQLINSYGNANPDQGFRTCRSIIHRFDSHSSDDDQVFSEDDEQGVTTPKGSKRKGPNSFVLKLTVQAIHLAANAPMVNHSIEINVFEI